VWLRQATLSPVLECDDRPPVDQEGHGTSEALGFAERSSPLVVSRSSELEVPEQDAGGGSCHFNHTNSNNNYPISAENSAALGAACAGSASARPSPRTRLPKTLSEASVISSSHVWHAVDDAAAAAAATVSWPRKTGTSYSKTDLDAISSSSSSASSSRHRVPLQPQQGGSGSQLSGGKRRHAKGSSNPFEAPPGSASHSPSASSPGLKMVFLDQVLDGGAAKGLEDAAPRRPTGRQPSQSSSSGSHSGSQGNPSDSEECRNMKRILTFSKELLPDLQKQQAFRPPARAHSRGQIFSSSDDDPAGMGNSAQDSWSLAASASEREDPSSPPVGAATPRMSHSSATTPKLGHSRQPSGAATPPLGHAGLTLSHSRQASGGGGNTVLSTPAPERATPGGVTYDHLSLHGSYAPSAAQSPLATPFTMGAMPLSGMLTPPMVSLGTLTPPLGAATPFDSDAVSVKILNGVSGEEEVHFFAPLQTSNSEQHFLSMLDKLCLQHSGQPLMSLNWLSRESPGSERFQRRKCDLKMMEELFDQWGDERSAVLLLCTVPVRPPSELLASKVRLRAVVPAEVHFGGIQPVRLQLDTSVLEAGHEYTVAFTHQWSLLTYSAEATLLPNHRGVELSLPWQMVNISSNNTTDGLYDIHLVIDGAFRSENRRTLTVGSSESEMSTSSTAKSTAGYVPMGGGAQ
ncbi:unnamed protein product, partial [Polarella glacialis]